MISHRHRFVFVHHPRTGGTSIETAFGCPPPFSNPEHPEERQRHLRLEESMRAGPRRTTTSRSASSDPWDRAVSRYMNLLAKRDRKSTEKSRQRWGWVTDFRSSFEREPLTGWNIGGDGFDFIGRFEKLADDFQTVCERVGADVTLPHLNKTGHAHYSTFYDDETRDLVARLCAADIEQFGYRYECGASRARGVSRRRWRPRCALPPA